MTVIIRCDAGSAIGGGHVKRCKTIAKEIKGRGEEVIFATRQIKGNMINELEKDYKVIKLKNTQKIKNGNKTENNYQKKKRERGDAKETLKMLSKKEKEKINHILIDHYTLGKTWEKYMRIKLKKFSYKRVKITAFEDIGRRKHNADIVISQANTLDNYNIKKRDAKVLCGPEYAIVGNRYRRYKQHKYRNKEIKRINIFFGSADNTQCTEKAIEALNTEEFRKIKIDIIIGSQNNRKKEIRESVRHLKNYEIHENLKNLADILIKANLAIGTGGVAAWERCCLNIPTLFITVKENQLSQATILKKEKQITLLGSNKLVSARDIRNEVTKVIRNPKKYRQKHSLIDGYGANRLVTAMMGKEVKLVLRKVMESDMEQIYKWVNESEVRRNSININHVSRKEHKEWFKRGLKNEQRLHYIAVDKRKCPVGQIRFDKNINDEYVYVDISVESYARGLGIGRRLLKKGIEKLKREWKEDIIIRAEIKSTNRSSQMCFTKLNFNKIGKKTRGNTILNVYERIEASCSQ